MVQRDAAQTQSQAPDTRIKWNAAGEFLKHKAASWWHKDCDKLKFIEWEDIFCE